MLWVNIPYPQSRSSFQNRWNMAIKITNKREGRNKGNLGNKHEPRWKQTAGIYLINKKGLPLEWMKKLHGLILRFPSKLEPNKLLYHYNNNNCQFQWDIEREVQNFADIVNLVNDSRHPHFLMQTLSKLPLSPHPKQKHY